VLATKSRNSLLGWLLPGSSLWYVPPNDYAPETDSVYTGSVDGQLIERVGQGSERTREDFAGDKADSEDTRETAGAAARYFTYHLSHLTKLSERNQKHVGCSEES
jgi:hypothetical protein